MANYNADLKIEYVHGVGCDWEALTPVADDAGSEGSAS